jgi:hypothetical protein
VKFPDKRLTAYQARALDARKKPAAIALQNRLAETLRSTADTEGSNAGDRSAMVASAAPTTARDISVHH